MLETFLRNKINQQFSTSFGKNWLDLESEKTKDGKIIFHENSIIKINEAKTRIKKEVNCKNLSNHSLVENLTFGFWIWLLDLAFGLGFFTPIIISKFGKWV